MAVSTIYTPNFSTLWTVRYNESVGIASLNYLSLEIGTVFAAGVSTHLNDRIYRYLRKRSEGEGRPEFRILIWYPEPFS